MSNSYQIQPIVNINSHLVYNKNKKGRYNKMTYLNKKISSIKFVDFYKKYTDLKSKLKVLDEALEEYKNVVLDSDEIADNVVFVKQVYYKTAFKNVVEAHEELINVKVCDCDQYSGQLFDTYV